MYLGSIWSFSVSGCISFEKVMLISKQNEAEQQHQTVPCWRAQWSGPGSCVRRGRWLSGDAPWWSAEEETHCSVRATSGHGSSLCLCFSLAQTVLALRKCPWTLYLDDTDQSFWIFLKHWLEGCSRQTQDGGGDCSSGRHRFIRRGIALNTQCSVWRKKEWWVTTRTKALTCMKGKTRQ